ncbi:MAG: YciK family oxidoreductase [Pseudomonadales bacterium]|nr:YciK family oxidoreductase [Pseudomonadales bacterium]
MPDGLLEGQIILVTGAGAGIGATAARCFASFGANVILLGRTQSKLESVYDQIKQETATDPVVVPYDLANYLDGGCNELLDMIIEHYGRLDGLLHNAGILGDKVPLEHYNLDTWNKVMQINVSAVHALTSAMLPGLRKSTAASVVFTSSSVGRHGRAYWGAYAVSKFAIEGMAQVLADETEQAGIVRVNTLNPGATKTAMRAAAYPNEDPESLQCAEDKMDLYLYLMGKQSIGVTGRQFSSANWEPI